MRYTVPISVIMPCYNAGKYVAAAIESILAQSFSDFEFIIIDDGSTDNSVAEISEFTDSRIRFIKFETNRADYIARNLGMKIAKGKYIAVMDADDIADRDRFQTQFDYLEQHAWVGAIGSQGRWMDADGNLTGKEVNKPAGSTMVLKTFLLMDSFVIHPTLMLRTSLLRKYQLYYRNRYGLAADYEFIVRCSNLFPFLNTHDILINYRHHNQQLSTRCKAIQARDADLVRIDQLRKFKLPLTEEEKQVFFRIMRRVVLENEQELTDAATLFEKLLEQNKKIKLYNHRLLTQVLDCVLEMAHVKVHA